MLLEQECIPVGCVPPALHHTGGVSLDRNPQTETPLWTETLLGQRPPPDKDLLDRDPPPDRDPSLRGQRPPLDRDPPPITESQTGVKTLPSSNFVCGR